jgi:hypothetical protein
MDLGPKRRRRRGRVGGTRGSLDGDGDATTSITVSIASSGSTGSWGLSVLQFRNATAVGASAGTNAASGGPSQAITTTQDNSAIVCVNTDFAAIDGTSRTWRTINSIIPTAGNGMERVYANPTGAYTAYVAYWTDAGTAGAKTAGLSAPVGQTYNIVAVEVKGVAGPPAPFSPTYIDWPLRQRHPKMRGAT